MKIEKTVCDRCCKEIPCKNIKFYTGSKFNGIETVYDYRDLDLCFNCLENITTTLISSLNCSQQLQIYNNNKYD